MFMPDPFAKVRLGRTNLEITRFGLGSAALGWMYEPVSRSAAQDTVRRAHELGCAFFDTSPLYGSGLAESRMGAVLRELPRDSFVLSDKVGYAIYPDTPLPDENDPAPPAKPGFDYSYDSAFRLVEGSLKRLGLDRIDILLIHDPEDYIDEALKGTYRALRKLRDEGTIGAIGAGMNFSNLLTRLAREAEFDCFLMAGRYTLLDQTALADLLPIAEQQGIAIYIGGPFNSGILADPFAERLNFNYGPAAAEWIDKARRLDAVCQRHGVPLKAAAIQFPLGHPAVVSVLSGARSTAELEENIAAFRVPIPAALWDDLRREGLLGEDVPTPQD
jgi:D-threo-aldose 1-dehydrogenase